MFHVELRQFPHVARAFNFTREQLDARILHPWVTGASIKLQDRTWSAQKSKLTVVEGPELAPGEIGLGRGWGNAAKEGDDVTAAAVTEAERQVGASPADELKDEIVAACASSPLALGTVVELIGRRNPQRRPSEMLAVAEQALWELLHHGQLELQSDGWPVDPKHWQAVLLSWPSWHTADVAVFATRSD
jgi:hypothetical protein